MRRTNTLIVIAFALLAMATVSCDKSRLGRDTGLNAGKGVGMMFRTSSSTSFSETKAVGAPVLNNIYGNEDDGFVIEEYVSDIEDVMRTPETKGTEIKQTTASSGNFNVANRQFQVMAFLDTTKTTSPGVEETYHINEFNYPAKYDGSKWNWVLGDDDAPCWRTSTKYSIWSYWPVDSEVTTGSRSAVSVPNWTSGTYNTVSFTHTVPKALEDQQDLLFAYNEETRDFAHIDGDEKKKYVYEDKEQTWIDNEGNDTQIFDNTNGNPKTRNIDIHFYHALAAVKFEIDPGAKKGVDIHSITLCKVSDGNIDTTTGIATTGTCSVTGSDLAAPPTSPSTTGTGGVSWSNLGGHKPLHYEFNDNTFDTNYDKNKTVLGGYTKTGDGVLFMIPQSASNIYVIVEFSIGDSETYARISEPISVNWVAGRYYTYRLAPKFHLPGELLNGDSRTILFPGLKTSSESGGAKAFNSNIDSKGVTCVGFMLASYASGIASNQSMFLMLAKNGTDPYPNVTGAQLSSGYGTTYTYDTWTDINFQSVDSELTSIAQKEPSEIQAAIAAIDSDKVFKFGLDSSGQPDDVPETYKSLENGFGNTGAGNGQKDEASLLANLKKGPFYYAYRIPENANNVTTDDVNSINFIFKASAGSNQTGFLAYILGVMVLEIAPDPSVPGNFNTIDWSTI